MNKRILGGLAVAAMLAGGLALTTGVASATDEARVEETPTEAPEAVEEAPPECGTYQSESCEQPVEKVYVRATFICKATQDGVTENTGTSANVGDYIFRIGRAADADLWENVDSVDYTAGVGGSGLFSGTATPGSQDFKTTQSAIAGVSVLTSPVANDYYGTASTNATPCEYPVIEVTPVTPTVTAPTCDAPGIVELPETDNYEWVKQDDGTYLAVADEGYVLADDAVTMFDPGDLDQLTGSQCEEETTTTTTLPTTEPPVTTSTTSTTSTTEAPTEAVAALPPAQAPTTTAPAPVATIPAAGLPATGSNRTGTTALIALLATSLGGAALFAARRRTATS